MEAVTRPWISATRGRRPSRVTPDDADVGQVEAAHLVGRAVAVLGGSDQAQPGVPLALELDDNVDEVLQQARAGDRPVLGDVPDEQHGDASGLGDMDEARGDLADLGDVAGGPLHLGAGDRLHRVDDDEVGCDRLDLAEDRGEVGLGGEEEGRGHGLDPLGAQPHLGGRLLTADVEDVSSGSGRAGGDIEQQGRLADPRLAGHEHDRSRDQTAPEHPIELADPGRPGHRGGAVHLTDPRGWRHRAGRGSRAWPTIARLAHRPPGLTFAAAAHPLDRAPAALRASVCRAPLAGPH